MKKKQSELRTFLIAVLLTFFIFGCLEVGDITHGVKLLVKMKRTGENLRYYLSQNNGPMARSYQRSQFENFIALGKLCLLFAIIWAILFLVVLPVMHTVLLKRRYLREQLEKSTP